MGGELMKRIFSLSAATLLIASLGACQEKGGALRVDKVQPDNGITGGGDHVVIRGAGFEPGKTQVEVKFGGHRAEQVSISAADSIAVVTPPGNKGPVTVTLMFDNGTKFEIRDGFHYVPPGANGDVRNAFFSGKPGAPGTQAR
jgi:hypothetical protein